jgi:hypothetical protein
MYHFDATIQMQPESTPIPMPISFEQAAERLEQLPRMFLEPDGAFVWVGEQEQGRWQVDGQLTDRDGHLLYVEVKGQCPEPAFDQLLAAFGWPETPLVFQLTREAIFLEEQPFRKRAESQSRHSK